ncbi:trans-resveratrol di-O-methyltransferase [Manihot esculenta]|uniref:Uncharacterized protein n=1 Tax=Manihot esculenta TaxID=3983 RepID=A0A2C9UTQ1_MANES|nr:trans-resveratrol di-O-methyltransferase [Manihot esculenta]OAY33980.1 hypothetical protein MANES_13G140400v8 [Manihot esculenta]
MRSLADGKQNAELLEAQSHIWNHIFNFINSMSLKSAVQLGIPDAIHSHGRPITISELIAALSLHPAKANCIPRLMRILVHSGFFARVKINQNDQEEGYILTNASQLLLKDHPLSVSPFLLAMLDPSLTRPWHYVRNWFQNDDPTPFATANGRTIWDFAGHEPEFNNLFNEAMASDARLAMNVLMNDCKGVFEGLRSLVDVGGGTGTVAKAIAKEFPQLECFVFDLPHVVAGLHGTHNLKYVGGSMFEAIPPADAILLKWIMHDWSHENCVKILKRCKEAIKGREGGKLIIIDMVMEQKEKEDHESKETELLFDMLMMVLYNSQERNEKEWAQLFSDAGFSNYKIISMLGLRSIIEVYP